MRLPTVLLLSLPAISVAQQVAFQRYSVSPPFGGSMGPVTTGPDGALWATDSVNGQINRVTVPGAASSFQVPNCTPFPSDCALEGITGGPDGAVWFTEWYHGTISRITTAGVVTNAYQVPSGRQGPVGITTGPDGNLWFCDQIFDNGDYSEIGRLTPAGAFTMYPIPYPGVPSSITTGPDGALWFIGITYVGRITTAGAITIYPVTVTDDCPYSTVGCPQGITTGPDGALWFGDGSSVGRITTSGAITYYPVPLDGTVSVLSIASGPDGNLWFLAGGFVYSMTPSGAMTQYYPGFSTSYSGFPTSITTGPGGTLWFTDGNTMGEVVFPTTGLAVSPSSGSHGTSLTFSSFDFKPGETVNIYSAGIGSPLVASAVADRNGYFIAEGFAPQAAYGERVFLGLGRTSGKLGAAYFITYPSLIATPNSGPPGTSVTVQGYGFWSFQPLTIEFNGTALGTPTANIYGSLTAKTAFTFIIPNNTAPGTYSITASSPTYEDLPSAAATFTVN